MRNRLGDMPRRYSKNHTVEESTRHRVQDIFKEVLRADQYHFCQGHRITRRIWSIPLQEHVVVSLQLAGGCTITIGNQSWPLVLIGLDRQGDDRGRYVKKGKRGTRITPGAIARIIDPTDGRQFRDLFRSPEGAIGTRRELSLVNRTNQLNVSTCHRQERERTVRGILGNVSDEWLRDHPHWWPEDDKLRPRGLTWAEWNRIKYRLRYVLQPIPEKKMPTGWIEKIRRKISGDQMI